MDAMPVKKSDPETMLVVEDEVFSRRAMLKLLKSAGFDVKGVASAEEALGMLGGESADLPHWVVIDVDLPGMCGLDLVRLLQSKPGVHAMLVTGTDKELVRDFCARNAVDYFFKPLDVSRFLDHLKRVSGCPQ
jgi:CheY-like chemotaxis protein